MLNQIFNEDCLEGMKRIPDGSIDCIITDPPYGVSSCAWDSVVSFSDMWKEFKRIIKPNGVIIVFGLEPFSSHLRISNLDMYKYDWVWEKSRPTGFSHSRNMPLRNYENISVFSDGIIQHSNLTTRRMEYYPQGVRKCNKKVKRSSKGFEGGMERKSQSNEYTATLENFPRMVLKFASESKTVHSTQKPVALIEYLVKTYTQEGQTILDPFIGSGTTAIACLNTNRNYIGFEKDTGYYKVCTDRINNHKIGK